jgi:hypothetical protein
MGNLFKTFETDKNLEKEGVWFEISPGVRFNCARMGPMNKTYKRALSKKMKPHQRQYQQGTLDEELGENLLMDVFIETVLLGWEGVTDREGKAIDLDFNNAKWLFAELPDVYRALTEESEKAGNYLVKEASDSGNV